MRIGSPPNNGIIVSPFRLAAILIPQIPLFSFDKISGDRGKIGDITDITDNLDNFRLFSICRRGDARSEMQRVNREYQ